MEWIIGTLIGVTALYIYGYFKQKPKKDTKEKFIVDNLERYAFKYCQDFEYYSNDELQILRTEYKDFYTNLNYTK